MPITNRDSTFLKIHEQILLEYQYGSNNDSRDHGINEFLILDNQGDEKQILNPNSYNIEQVNDDDWTNNTPFRSVVQKALQQSSKFVWLGVDSQNPSVTDWVANEGTSNNIDYLADANPGNPRQISYQTSGELIQEGVVYDTVRLHFPSGFDFDQTRGLVIKSLIKDSDDAKIVLANHLLYELIHDREFNPEPVIFDETLFETYIEFKIPAPSRLQEEYIRVENQYTTSVDKLANSLLHNVSNTDLSKYPYVNFQLSEIQSIEKASAVMKNHPNYIEDSSDYTFIYTITTESTSIPISTQFSKTNITIDEASDGDYFNIQARFSSIPIGDFIDSLNNRTGGNNIIIYDIQVEETLPNLSTEVTHQSRQTQRNDFNSSIKFRPVIVNSDAISFTIDVQMRIFDTISSSAITRTTSETFVEASTGAVHRYGKYQNKISLNNIWPEFSFKEHKVYNVNPTTPIVSLPDTLNDVLVGNNIKYKHRYYDVSNIVIEDGTVEIDEEGNVASEDSINVTKLFGKNNRLVIVLNSTNNYFKFVIYNKRNKYYLRQNISNRGNFMLKFGDDDTGELRFDAISDTAIKPATGELLFKIDSENHRYLRRIQETNNRFEIVNQNFGEETTVYTGRFRFNNQEELPGEFSTSELQNRNLGLSQEVSRLNRYVEYLQEEWGNSTEKVETLKKDLRNARLIISQLKSKIQSSGDLISPGNDDTRVYGSGDSPYDYYGQY